ncbi:YeeE/YedE family protein [Bartonella apis]|uniref:YeeE/YedE family protein n=1 Tax=Bartonella apis TaxID=1686310 RepID=UPI00243333E9|nr:YeeE/YedE family protein [Bartonella apis]MCT6886498.1 YeeE/YedE family protein [Bartonella apis]
MYTVVSGQPQKLSHHFTLPKIISALFIVLAAIWLSVSYSVEQGLLLLVGAALGITLYHASFGFTSAWRNFILEGRGRGLRVQMLMLAIAVLLFFPTLSLGEVFGHPVNGSLAPLSLSVIIGAFMFGVGMQLAGGCASGVLFTLGGGNARMLLVLAFFVLGGFVSTAHASFWANMPALKPVSLVKTLGAPLGILVSLMLFAIIASVTVIIEKRRHGALEQEKPTAHKGLQRFFRGPWPMVWGGIALALLNYLTLVISGKPWSIAGAFPIWGAKISSALGVDVASWQFWQNPGNAKNLSSSIFSNVTSVMDFGIIAGAMLAAGLAGRFAFKFRMPVGSACAAVIGGLLLGYGARVGFGCNIGAYFSGIASGSLHGWLWVVAAFFGNTAGVYLRPVFYKNPQTAPQIKSC